ncbi:hypothetical protein NHX12_025759, partial [Muraenolepis orangiensis]
CLPAISSAPVPHHLPRGGPECSAAHAFTYLKARAKGPCGLCSTWPTTRSSEVVITWRPSAVGQILPGSSLSRYETQAWLKSSLSISAKLAGIGRGPQANPDPVTKNDPEALRYSWNGCMTSKRGPGLPEGSEMDHVRLADGGDGSRTFATTTRLIRPV